MMRKLLFALLVAAFAPAVVSAQTTISYTSGPTGGTGSITVSGSYTLATGQSAMSITLYCVDSCGQGVQIPAFINSMNLTWSLTSSCVPAGTYVVYARLYSGDLCGGMYINDTLTKQSVTVN